MGESELYVWVLLPVLIFLARVIDVSMGTIRVIFISRGHKLWAPLIGFFEVLIWLVAMGQIMQNLSNPATYLAFAAGFATGNYVGLRIAEKLSLGIVTVRVITNKPADGLLAALIANNYSVTSLDAEGARGRVKVLFTVLPRKCAHKVVELVDKFDHRAFYTIEEVSYVTARPDFAKTNALSSAAQAFKPARKGK